MSEDPGFLSRWARRKRAALRGEAPVEEARPGAAATEAPPLPRLADPMAEVDLAAPAPADPVEELPAPAAAAEAEPFDVSSLPPVELLDAASDFSVFLKPGVPAALRSAALRKAWTADPLIRDYLSPLDYGWDFNAPGGLPFGFGDALGEGADKVLQLIRQAVGEPEPPPEDGAPPELAPPERVPLEELPDAERAVAEADLPAVAEAADTEPAEPPRRRHGGALPA